MILKGKTRIIYLNACVFLMAFSSLLRSSLRRQQEQEAGVYEPGQKLSLFVSLCVCYVCSLKNASVLIHWYWKWIKIDAFIHQLAAGYLPKKGTSIYWQPNYASNLNYWTQIVHKKTTRELGKSRECPEAWEPILLPPNFDYVGHRYMGVGVSL